MPIHVYNINKGSSERTWKGHVVELGRHEGGFEQVMCFVIKVYCWGNKILIAILNFKSLILP